jgi:hypothetical protein
VALHDRAPRFGKLVQAAHDIEQGRVADIGGEPGICPPLDHGLNQCRRLDHGPVDRVFRCLEAAGNPHADMSAIHWHSS